MSGLRAAEVFGAIRFRYVNSALTFASGIIIARAITVEERGALSYVMTVVDIALLVLSFGISKVLLNLVVRSGSYRRFTTPFAAVVTLGLFGAAVLVAILHVAKPEFRPLLAIIAAYTFFRTQFTLIDARERGRLKFSAFYRYFRMERMLALAGLLAAVVLGADLRGVLLCLAAASGLTIVIYLYRQPITWGRVSGRQLGLIGRRIWPVGLYNVAASFTAFALVRLDIVLIGERFGDVQLGYFAIAMILMTIVGSVGQSFVFVAIPRLIGTDAGTPDATRTPALITFAAMAALFALLWLVGPQLITFFYGERFAPSGDMLRVLVFVGLALASKTLMESRLVADNRFGALLGVNLAALALKVVILGGLALTGGLTFTALILTSAVSLTATLPLLLTARLAPGAMARASRAGID